MPFPFYSSPREVFLSQCSLTCSKMAGGIRRPPPGPRSNLAPNFATWSSMQYLFFFKCPVCLLRIGGPHFRQNAFDPHLMLQQILTTPPPNTQLNFLQPVGVPWARWLILAAACCSVMDLTNALTSTSILLLWYLTMLRKRCTWLRKPSLVLNQFSEHL